MLMEKDNGKIILIKHAEDWTTLDWRILILTNLCDFKSDKMLFQNRILLWEKGNFLLMFTSPCKVLFLCALTFNILK